MCLAIVKPAGLDVPEKNLRSGYEHHNDGCGIAWAENGELHVEKGMLTWDAFLGLYEGVKEHPCLIHFRKATHGPKNETNCHPFLFNDGKLALIHNGVIQIKIEDNALSDTGNFVKSIMDPIVKTAQVPLDHPALAFLIQRSIGTDKVAIMDGNGKVIFFNEDKGTVEDKIWYSNCSFRWTGNNTRHNTGGYLGNNRSTTSSSSIPSGTRRANDDDETDNHYWGRINRAATAPMIIEDGTKLEPGMATEYGYYEEDIEKEIEDYILSLGMTRQEAITRCFNNVD